MILAYSVSTPRYGGDGPIMTFPEWVYYSLAVLLFLANIASVGLNGIGLPGNWFVLAGSSLFAVLVQCSNGAKFSWSGIASLVVLAFVGEGLEMLAGIAGVARLKASRRGIALSLVGSLSGGILGAAFGLPIPVIGTALGALIGGSFGAFAGAVLGEGWKGQSADRSLAIGWAAFWGRLLGTFGKIAVGMAMVVVALIDAFR